MDVSLKEGQGGGFMRKIIILTLITSLAFVMMSCTREPVPAFSDYRISEVATTDAMPDGTVTISDAINDITDRLIGANVTVKTWQYLWFKRFGTLYFGSGVVIYASDTYQYVLTNAHVIELDPDYTARTLEVEDGTNMTYEAFLYEGSVSTEHDLALLVVSAPEGTFEPVTIRTEDPEVFETIFSVGTPEGQKNAIRTGEVTGYEQIRVDLYEAGDVTLDFDSVVHTARTEQGSSGGMLLDMHGTLIGVNYARNADESLDLGYAIPASVVLDYLYTYVFGWNS
jgi:S1-C subfamily serine protease